MMEGFMESSMPLQFLDYQIMFSRAAQTHDPDGAPLKTHPIQILCAHVTENHNGKGEIDWIDRYIFIHNILYNPLLMMPGKNPILLETLTELFVTDRAIRFDLRFQGFINLFEKLPTATSRMILDDMENEIRTMSRTRDTIQIDHIINNIHNMHNLLK